MDDYSALSNTNLELKIIEQFEKRGISFTLGVIPYICQGNQKDPSTQVLMPLPPEKVDVLNKKIKSGTIDVALHGFSHQTTTPLDPTEFSGIGYSEQVKRLEKGKELIEKQIGVKIESFVPPWNRYDKNTLLALEDAGFKILSAGWKGEVFDECGIRFLPTTCDFSKISTAIERAMLSSDAQPLITVLFHEYDFKETGDPRGSISVEELGQLLERLTSQDNLKVISIGQADKEISDLSAKRFAAFINLRFWDRLLPIGLQTKKPVLQYFETRKLSETRFKVAILQGILMFVAAYSCFFIGYKLSPVSESIIMFVTMGIIFLAMGIVAYAFKGFDVSLRGLVVSVTAVGSSIGFLIAYLLQRWMG